MKKLLLMRSQKNQVLEEIEDRGLLPSQFEWVEVSRERIPTVADAAIVSVLVHSPTGYSFLFDIRHDSYWATYSPGHESPQQTSRCDDWEEMLRLVRKWTENLQREVESPDLWSMVTQETKLAEVAAEARDIPLTEEQQDQVARGIEEIRQFLVQHFDKQDQKIEFIREKLEYLESASKRMSRRDWIHTAIGILFTIVVGVGLAPNEARDLFRLAAKAFAELLTKLLV
ncbi:MAG: hypothetical protein ACYTBX_19690 [Planctomycetota bacterium]|jgi:hypothetical protein